MKKKILSVVLCITLILSIFSIIPFSAFAEEVDVSNVGVISGDYEHSLPTVTSNLYLKVDDQLYPVEKGNTYTYSYYLNVPEKVEAFDATTFYDVNGVKWTPILDEDGEVDETALFPVAKGTGMMTSYNVPGQIMYNDSYIKGYKFTTDDAKLITTKFLVTADEGIYEIRTAIKTLVDINDHKYVFNGEIVDPNFVARGVIEGVTPILYKYQILADGTAEITKYYGSGGDVTIPSTLDGYKVTSIGNSAFYSCRSLTSITIPNSVTSIGDSAFEDCTSLTSVTIPNSVTSIGDWAFYGVPTDFIIYAKINTVACKYAIQNGYIFANTLDNIKYKGKGNDVAVVGYFDAPAALEISSKISEYTVTSIGGSAFRDCTSLKSITIPNSVTSIGRGAFYDCTSLESITIPNSVSSIGDEAFHSCKSLTSVTIGNSVTNIGKWAFNGTPWYENLPVGLVYAGRVAYKYKGKMPEGTSITLKDGTVGIAGSAFEDCRGLTNITIPDSVTSIGSGAFFDCTNLMSVIIPPTVTSIGLHAFGYYYDTYWDRTKKN